jgi:hypothetical protein
LPPSDQGDDTTAAAMPAAATRRVFEVTGHVNSGKAFYSAPWRLMGDNMVVRTAGDIVQVFHHDIIVATHVCHLTGRSTNVERVPPWGNYMAADTRVRSACVDIE